jgi:MFS family permease
VAGPFFAPFMLADLRFTYAEFMALIAVAYVARIVALPVLGRWTSRHGARPVLWLGGVAIVPMSVLWAFSHDYGYLVAIQVLSGIAWGAYELATQLLFFETIRRDERTSVLTYFNLANAAAMVGGSLVGGAVLHGFGSTRLGYLAVFALSFVGRLAGLALLVRVARAPRRLTRFVMRVLTMRAAEGTLASPVLPSVVERAPRAHPARRAGD